LLVVTTGATYDSPEPRQVLQHVYLLG